MTYFDHAATTDTRESVIAAMVEEMRRTGNASSLHKAGRTSRKSVEIARERIARSLDCLPSEVIFTSGGTESDNLAIKGLFWQRIRQHPQRKLVVALSIEHHAVLDPIQWLVEAEGAEVHWISVNAQGLINIDEFRDVVQSRHEEISLVSVMWANNEVGTVQPISHIVEIAHEYGIPVHSDAVQAVGSLPVSFKESALDALTLSGHKIGGPMGIGALLLKREHKPVPVLHGGGQEREIRSGTLATSLIVGLGVALEEAALQQPHHYEHVQTIRDVLISRIESEVPGSVLRGDRHQRLPGNAHFTFDGCEGDALLMLLDAAGIHVSTGSACTAGIPQPSHVLLGMGVVVTEAVGALRFSLGASSTIHDVDALMEVLPEVVLRAQRAGKTLKSQS